MHSTLYAQSQTRPLAIAVAGMVALAIVMGIGRFALTPMLPLMLGSGWVDLHGGGWLASANYAGYFVGALLCTARRDLPRHVMRHTLLAVILLTALMSFQTGLFLWLLLRFVIGVITAVGFVAISAWCLGWLTASNHVRLSGIMFAGSGAGIFIGGLAGSAMFNFDWHPTAGWLSFALLAAVGSLLVWRVVDLKAPSTLPQDAQAAGGRPASASGRRTGRSVVSVGQPVPGQSAKSICLVRRLIVSGHILAYGIAGFGYIITATFLPVMAQAALGEGVGQSLLWPLFGLCIALGAALSVGIPAGWNRPMLLAIAYILQGMGLLCTIFLVDIAGFALGSILVGAPLMVITMLGMREAQRLGGDRKVQLMGAMTASYALGQIAGPPLATHLIDSAGGFGASLGLAAGSLFAGAMLYAALYGLERNRRSSMAST